MSVADSSGLVDIVPLLTANSFREMSNNAAARRAAQAAAASSSSSTDVLSRTRLRSISKAHPLRLQPQAPIDWEETASTTGTAGTATGTTNGLAGLMIHTNTIMGHNGPLHTTLEVIPSQPTSPSNAAIVRGLPTPSQRIGSGGGGAFGGFMNTNQGSRLASQMNSRRGSGLFFSSPPPAAHTLQMDAFDTGVGITALNLLPLSPLIGVRNVQHPEQSLPTPSHTRRPPRSGLLGSLCNFCGHGNMPMDTYVRVTLLPCGIGQATEVRLNSGPNVTWKMPQRLKIFFDPNSRETVTTSQEQQEGDDRGGGGGGGDEYEQQQGGMTPGVGPTPRAESSRMDSQQQDLRNQLLQQQEELEDNEVRPATRVHSNVTSVNGGAEDAVPAGRSKRSSMKRSTLNRDIPTTNIFLPVSDENNTSTTPLFSPRSSQQQQQQPAVTPSASALASPSASPVTPAPAAATVLSAEALAATALSASPSPSPSPPQATSFRVSSILKRASNDPAQVTTSGATSATGVAGPAVASTPRSRFVYVVKPNRAASVLSSTSPVPSSTAASSTAAAAPASSSSPLPFPLPPPPPPMPPQLPAPSSSSHRSSRSASSSSSTSSSSASHAQGAHEAHEAHDVFTSPILPSDGSSSNHPSTMSFKTRSNEIAPLNVRTQPKRVTIEEVPSSPLAVTAAISSAAISVPPTPSNNQMISSPLAVLPRSVMNSAQARSRLLSRTSAATVFSSPLPPAPGPLIRPLLLVEVICCAPTSSWDEEPGNSGGEFDIAMGNPTGGGGGGGGNGGAGTGFLDTESDRLVSSATLDLASFLSKPNAHARASLNLTDVETLDQQGVANIVVEFRPDPCIDHQGLAQPSSPTSAAHASIVGNKATTLAGSGGAGGGGGTVTLPAAGLGAGYFHIEVVALLGLRDPFNESVLEEHADWSLIWKMGLVVLIYLALGVGFYVRYEGWSLLEAIYFCVVTAATVGYGDLHPVARASKVFTMFFVLVGIGMIAIAVGIAGGLILERQEQEIYRSMMAEKTRASSGKDPAATKLKGTERWLGHTSKRLLLSFLLFHAVLWGGTFGFMHFEDLHFIDALYLCVITMSTVGYGDDAPKSDSGRAFCIPWIVISTVTVTRIIGDITNAYMNWARNQRAKQVLKTSVQCQWHTQCKTWIDRRKNKYRCFRLNSHGCTLLCRCCCCCLSTVFQLWMILLHWMMIIVVKSRNLNFSNIYSSRPMHVNRVRLILSVLNSVHWTRTVVDSSMQMISSKLLSINNNSRWELIKCRTFDEAQQSTEAWRNQIERYRTAGRLAGALCNLFVPKSILQ